MALKKRVIHEHGSAALSSSCLHVPHHMGGCWIPRHPPECPTLNGKMPGPPYSPPTWPPSHTEAARHVPHHMGICPHAHTHYLHVLYHMGRCWAPRHPPLTCPPSHTEDAVTPTPITYVFPSHTEDARDPHTHHLCDPITYGRCRRSHTQALASGLPLIQVWLPVKWMYRKCKPDLNKLSPTIKRVFKRVCKEAVGEEDAVKLMSTTKHNKRANSPSFCFSEYLAPIFAD